MIRKGKVVLGRRAARTATNKNLLNEFVMFDIILGCHTRTRYYRSGSAVTAARHGESERSV